MLLTPDDSLFRSYHEDHEELVPVSVTLSVVNDESDVTDFGILSSTSAWRGLSDGDVEFARNFPRLNADCAGTLHLRLPTDQYKALLTEYERQSIVVEWSGVLTIAESGEWLMVQQHGSLSVTGSDLAQQKRLRRGWYEAIAWRRARLDWERRLDDDVAKPRHTDMHKALRQCVRGLARWAEAHSATTDDLQTSFIRTYDAVLQLRTPVSADFAETVITSEATTQKSGVLGYQRILPIVAAVVHNPDREMLTHLTEETLPISSDLFNRRLLHALLLVETGQFLHDSCVNMFGRMDIMAMTLPNAGEEGAELPQIREFTRKRKRQVRRTVVGIWLPRLLLVGIGTASGFALFGWAGAGLGFLIGMATADSSTDRAGRDLKRRYVLPQAMEQAVRTAAIETVAWSEIELSMHRAAAAGAAWGGRGMAARALGHASGAATCSCWSKHLMSVLTTSAARRSHSSPG